MPENEEVKDDSKPGTSCIRCGKPMDPKDPCDCNELVYVYWEM
jgi:hypothetical protein